MEIKAVIVKKDNKAIDCYEVVSFSVEQFNQMLKTCDRNKKTLYYEELRKEQQLNNRIYALEKELALLKQKVENNTKLILGETTDEK